MNTTTINGFVVPKAIRHVDGFDQVWAVAPYEKSGYANYEVEPLSSSDPAAFLAVLNGAAYDSEEKVKAVVNAMRGIDPKWGE